MLEAPQRCFWSQSHSSWNHGPFGGPDGWFRQHPRKYSGRLITETGSPWVLKTNQKDVSREGDFCADCRSCFLLLYVLDSSLPKWLAGPVEVSPPKSHDPMLIITLVMRLFHSGYLYLARFWMASFVGAPECYLKD